MTVRTVICNARNGAHGFDTCNMHIYHTYMHHTHLTIDLTVHIQGDPGVTRSCEDDAAGYVIKSLLISSQPICWEGATGVSLGNV